MMREQRIHLRADNLSPLHLRFTVFQNGANCGHLTMRHDEAIAFRETLTLGLRDDDTGLLEVSGPWPTAKP